MRLIVFALIINRQLFFHYFLLNFTSEVFGKLVLENNRYATQSLRAQPPSSPCRSKMRPWEEMDEDDLGKFIGLMMLTGITERRGNLETYWSKDIFLGIPIFPQVTMLTLLRFPALVFLNFNFSCSAYFHCTCFLIYLANSPILGFFHVCLLLFLM